MEVAVGHHPCLDRETNRKVPLRHFVVGWIPFIIFFFLPSRLINIAVPVSFFHLDLAVTFLGGSASAGAGTAPELILSARIPDDDDGGVVGVADGTPVSPAPDGVVDIAAAAATRGEG
jgi:hypothetical protein